MPSITVREYHPESGALLGNVSIISFGKIAAGMHTRVKAIDIAFGGVTVVGNVKLGLIANGGLIVNTNPTDIQTSGTDGAGSAGNGYFGVESSSTFDSTVTAANLSRHFAGVNTSITPSDSNNVSVGARTSTISNYIYVDVEISESISETINGAYKVFFDYS